MSAMPWLGRRAAISGGGASAGVEWRGRLPRGSSRSRRAALPGRRVWGAARRGLLEGWSGGKRSRRAALPGRRVWGAARCGFLEGWSGGKRSRRAALPGLVLFAFAVAASGGLSHARTAGDPPRRVVVLGDMHLGEGRGADGAWSPYEDFRWADDLRGFLDALADVGAPTDLVLNGDTFDLLQAGDGACAHDDPDLGCSEAEALARLDRVLAAHRGEVAALAAFAASGDNRLVLVPGDHDAALLFPAVGRRAVEAFAAAPGRVSVAGDGYWRSADGLIHAEHGHQIEHRADRFERWPAPFETRSGSRRLERPWGQSVVQALYDRYEPRFPIVDNLAEDGAGVREALAAAGVDDAGAAAPDLLRFLLFRMSWQQFRMDLDRGDVEPPAWDLGEVRAAGPRFLVDSLADDDRFKPVAARALDAGRLTALMEALGDDELTALCDHRAALRRARRRFERILTQFDPTGPPVAECPRTPETAAPRFEYFWGSRDRVFGRHLEQMADPRPVAVMVHGHTHLADYRQGNFTRVEAGRTYVVDGFSPVRGAATPVVVNGGAWQRTVTPRQLDEHRRRRGVSEAGLLESMRPEQLPPCYSFVQIEPYTERPEPPMLRYWRQADDGTWTMAPRCGRRIDDRASAP